MDHVRRVLLATLGTRAASCTEAANLASRGRFGTLSLIFDKKPAPAVESCANIRDIEVFMARLGKRRRSSSTKAPVRSGCSVLSPDPIPVFLRKNPVPSESVIMGKNFLLTLLVLACLGIPGIAQQTTDVNDVHVQPRELEKPIEAP